METLETAIMTDMWHSILSRFNATSEKLQSASCELQVAVDLLQSLTVFLEDIRGRFDEFEARGIKLSGCSVYHSNVVRRRKISRRQECGLSEGTTLSGRDKFQVETFLVIVDQLTSSLKVRLAAYTDVHSRFQVLTDFKKLSLPSIRELAIKLSESYPADLDSDVIADEMIQLIEYAKLNECKSPGEIAQMMHDEQLQDTFPNACVALRIYLSLMVSNCSGERSFSKMALIKNKLRSTMGDKRLSALELLSMESDMLDKIPIEHIIEQFAATKSRKYC
jgi:hypothetical protein